MPWLQVYQLLKQHLSKYVLAETVDEPASIPPSSPAAEAETEAAEGKDKDEAAGKAADSGSTTAEGAATATAVAAGEKSDGGVFEADDDDDADDETKAASPSHPRKRKRKVDGENGRDAPVVEKTAEETAEKTAAVAARKPDPNGPKCVQLKMKPDWRRTGGGKRRRGNLNKDAGGGRGGGRWAWPEDRPEYCRFVLYKENSDTVSGIIVCNSDTEKEVEWKGGGCCALCGGERGCGRAMGSRLVGVVLVTCRDASSCF